MSTLAAPRTLSTAELAHRLRCSPEYVENMLKESVEQGYVEHDDAGWRLSPWAERRFGQVLRSLGEWA